MAYYRVSTQKQGESGLGLATQQAAVRAYVPNPAAIVATFQEVESSKNNRRPELAQAVAECRCLGTTLLVAKLDHMSRNAAYILRLSGRSRVETTIIGIESASPFMMRCR